MIMLNEAKWFGDRNTINIEGTVEYSKSGSREGKEELTTASIHSTVIEMRLSKRLRVKYR